MLALKVRYRSIFLKPDGLASPLEQCVTSRVRHGTQNTEEVALIRWPKEEGLLPDVACVRHFVSLAPVRHLLPEVPTVKVADRVQQITANLLRAWPHVVGKRRKHRHKIVTGCGLKGFHKPGCPGQAPTIGSLMVCKRTRHGLAEVPAMPPMEFFVVDLDVRGDRLAAHQVH